MRYQDKDIFVIPIGDKLNLSDNSAVSILYAPLCGQIAFIGKEDEDEIRRYVEEGVTIDEDLKELVDEMLVLTSCTMQIPDISKTTKMSLLPNSACNFACSYCYSAKGRSSTVLSWEMAKIALDYFINPERVTQRNLSLFISGGGEPLLSWDITKRCIAYATSRSKELGFTIRISIITNGSLITKEMAGFLLEHDCSVCISFEVLRELQDKQRKNFEGVHKNILQLGELGLQVMLNSTITPISVGHMQEMVSTVADRYPFVAQYTMEPVTSIELFRTAQELGCFYDNFYNNYIEAKQIAKDKHVPLRFTFDDELSDVTIRHCPGKFCITPQGTISVCHLVSSPKEERYKECIYGKIEGGTLEIDKNRFNQLYSITLFSYDRCRDCFAKFSCGGECLTRNTIYPADYMQKVCNFNRKFVLHQLLEKIEENIYEESGLTLEEYVKVYR